VKSGTALRVVRDDAPSSRPARAPRAAGVVEQVRVACRPKARLATFLGFLLGGFVPLASFEVAHYEVDPSQALYAQLPVYLVAGGLLFSMVTVYAWAKLAFGAPVKALGFVVLLEGVMVTSHAGWLAVAALGYLVAINGIATGCALALRRAS
jgi:hypothetical protein